MTRAAATRLVLFSSLIATSTGCGQRRIDASPPPATKADVAPSSAEAGALRAPDASAPDLAREATLALPIPARAQAPESPPSGWCGETAIQEGLLHLGVWAPQQLINRAGKPVHPDLYATEIPVALDALGVRYSVYTVRERGFGPFARWTRSALEAGDPVIAGVKILPTEHPDWGLDHFVLVMGHGPKGLLVNTTWGSREWVGDTTTPGLSLKNAFYGIRLHGLRLPAQAVPAHLTLVDEGATSVKLHVTCTGTKSGARYRLERHGQRSDDKPVSIEELTASGERVEHDLAVEADKPARFHCVPL